MIIEGKGYRTNRIYEPEYCINMFSLRSALILILGVASVSSFQHVIRSNANLRPLNAQQNKDVENNVSFVDTFQRKAAVVAATMSLAFCVAMTPNPAFASDKAAQISLEKIPPTAISIQIQDLPVVGSILSGYYTKVDTKIDKPSIVIQSPKDKVGAISAIAKGGHLEFDVTGKINTHLDVDVAADEPGTLKVLVQSNLIPKLPFKNLASTAFTSPIAGGKESAWNIVTNLGTGESYYYNLKTGVTQYARPDKI